MRFLSVGVDIDFQMFNKTSTRLPEALLFAFRPETSKSWQMSKLGHLVDPLNVVLNGSQYQHGEYVSRPSVNGVILSLCCFNQSISHEFLEWPNYLKHC